MKLTVLIIAMLLLTAGGCLIIYSPFEDMFGIRTFSDPEGMAREKFIAAIVMMVIFLSLFLLNKKNYQAIIIPIVVSIIMIIVTGASYFDKSEFYSEFSGEAWHSSKTAIDVKIKMARGLVHSGELLSMSKPDLTGKLGKGAYNAKDQSMTFEIHEIRYLVVNFENQLVKSAYLYCDCD